MSHARRETSQPRFNKCPELTECSEKSLYISLEDLLGQLFAAIISNEGQCLLRYGRGILEPMLRHSRRYLCAVIPHDVPAVLHAAGTHARVPRPVQGGRTVCRLEGYQTVVLDEVSGASESGQIPTCAIRRYESWAPGADCFQDHRRTHRLDVALSR